MTDQKIQSLCEAVADIAFIAGEQKFYSGDSRADISNFIEWAKEFEEINNGVEWGVDDGKDYIEAIHDFAHSKLNPTL